MTTEPTVQVPVSLINRLLGNRTTDDLAELRALLVQPTPSATLIPVSLIQNAPHDDWCGARKFPRRECDCWKQWVASLLAKPLPPTAPPSIADMAPGTELTADYHPVTRRVRVIDTGSVWLRGIDDESPSVRVDDLDPSTIRNVTPPA